VDEPLDRDESADKDREHDRETGQTFSFEAAEEEGEAERDRGQRIAEVVDQVGKQRDAECARVDECLCDCRECENGQAPRDGSDAGAGAKDRTIDQPVRVLVLLAFVFNEPQLDLLGFMVSLVQTKHGAVWSAEMTHSVKLPPAGYELPARGRLGRGRTVMN
jgi:hypothetical protein